VHFVLFHPHGKPDWHPNITNATPGVVEVGAGVGAGAVVGLGAEAEELL
jgi:hypothetical protein